MCEHVCSIQVIRILISKATADSIQNCLMSLLLGKATQAFVEDFSSSQRLLVEIFFPEHAIPHAGRFNLMVGLALC